MPNSDTFDVASIIRSLRNDQKLDLAPTAFIPQSLISKEREAPILHYSLTNYFVILISNHLCAIIDAYYYWHIDIYVIIGLLTIFLFLFLGIFLDHKH